MRSIAFKKFAAVALAVTLIVPINVGKLNGNVAKAAETQGKITFNGDFTTDEGAMDFEGWNGIAAGEVKDKINKNVRYSWDFESGTVPADWSNTSIIENEKHNGSYAAKVTNTGVLFTTHDAGSFNQLDAGKDWVMSAWVYSETDATIAINANMWYDGDWNDQEKDLSLVKTDKVVEAGKWTLIEHKISAKTKKIMMQPQILHSAGADIYIDDVEIYSTEPAIDKKEVTVKSFTFDEDVDAWYAGDNGASVETATDGEKNVLKATFNENTINNWTGIRTPEINVEAGKEYTFIYDIKIESYDSSKEYQCFACPWENNSPLYIDTYASMQADKNKLGEWQTLSIPYTATTNKVFFNLQLGNTPGVVYYDNVKLIQIEKTPVKEVTKDGVVAEGPNGTNALAFAQATDLYNNTFTTVKKGNTYAYSFYAKTANTEEGFEFKPYVSYGSDNIVELNGKQTGNSEWTKYTGTFVADEIAEGETFKIGFARKGTGDAYVAAIELEETAVETTKPEETTTKPEETTTKPEETTTKPEETTTKPEETTTKVPETTKAPETTTTKVEKTTTAKKVQPTTTKKPLDKTKITKKPSKKLSSKKVKLTFKTVKKAKKYTVQFSVTKKFKKVLYTKTVKSTKVTISSSKLKNKKKLYVRVRAVGAKKWSSVVTIKVKK